MASGSLLLEEHDTGAPPAGAPASFTAPFPGTFMSAADESVGFAMSPDGQLTLKKLSLWSASQTAAGVSRQNPVPAAQHSRSFAL